MSDDEPGLPPRLQECLRNLGYEGITEARFSELLEQYLPMGPTPPPRKCLWKESDRSIWNSPDPHDLPGPWQLQNTAPTTAIVVDYQKPQYEEICRLVWGSPEGPAVITSDDGRKLTAANPAAGRVLNVLVVSGDSPFPTIGSLAATTRLQVTKGLTFGGNNVLEQQLHHIPLPTGAYEVTLRYFEACPQGVDYVICLRPCRSVTKPAAALRL